MSSDSRAVACTAALPGTMGFPLPSSLWGTVSLQCLPLHLEDMDPLLSGLACVGRGTGIMFYPSGKPSISRKEQRSPLSVPDLSHYTACPTQREKTCRLEWGLVWSYGCGRMSLNSRCSAPWLQTWTAINFLP